MSSYVPASMSEPLLLIPNRDEHFAGSSPAGGGTWCSGNYLVLVSTLVAVCGSYAFGNAVGYSSPAESGIINDLDLSTAEAMWLSDAFCITGWLVIIFAKVPVYVAEITPKNIRGRFTSLNQLMIGIGKAIRYLIGSLVNWRILAVIGTVPCLIQLIGLFFIPESPRWLAKTGREKELEASLQRLRGKKTDISQEASEIIDYLQRKYAYSLTIGVGLMIFQQFGGLNGFVFYASAIFEAGGFPASLGNILASVVQIVGTTTGVILIDKSGRRPLLLISAAGTCLGCFLTGLSFFFQDLTFSKELVSGSVLVGVLVFLASFEFGMGGIPWIIMSEIFPINIKGSAGSLVNLVSWSGSWTVSYTYNFLFEWSSAGTFFIFAGICGAGIVLIGKLVPETKGRTLEEIQVSICNETQD